MTSDEFATRFLQEEKVAVVPGSGVWGQRRGLHPYFLRLFPGESESCDRAAVAFCKKTESGKGMIKIC